MRKSEGKRTKKKTCDIRNGNAEAEVMMCATQPKSSTVENSPFSTTAGCSAATGNTDPKDQNRLRKKPAATRTMEGVWVMKGYPPTLRKLAEKYKVEKKICRKCGATNPIGATNCRKRACGHSTDLRDRHKKEMKSGKKNDPLTEGEMLLAGDMGEDVLRGLPRSVRGFFFQLPSVTNFDVTTPQSGQYLNILHENMLTFVRSINNLSKYSEQRRINLHILRLVISFDSQLLTLRLPCLVVIILHEEQGNDWSEQAKGIRSNQLR
ncbi:hypothetical protein WR25_13840 [Diploscapter pachys]|uniref:Ubiquitin-ribosomal protein eL40 fusion protein n=1 Tax=Diploscapter pachys TaxID=2018661 RepID=A0A2A2KKE1_9BILA|nr:hypothetical protein WR25_13840 [Diploscapter pachys]